MCKCCMSIHQQSISIYVVWLQYSHYVTTLGLVRLESSNIWRDISELMVGWLAGLIIQLIKSLQHLRSAFLRANFTAGVQTEEFATLARSLKDHWWTDRQAVRQSGQPVSGTSMQINSAPDKSRQHLPDLLMSTEELKRAALAARNMLSTSVGAALEESLHGCHFLLSRRVQWLFALEAQEEQALPWTGSRLL